MKRKQASREAQANKSTSLKEIDFGTTHVANLLKGSTSETTASVSSRQQLINEQKEDVEIAKLRDNAVSEDEAKQLAECYYLKDNLLIWKWSPSDNESKDDWCETHQIVVPERYRNDILRIALDLPNAGHMGVTKTHRRVLPYFY